MTFAVKPSKLCGETAVGFSAAENGAPWAVRRSHTTGRSQNIAQLSDELSKDLPDEQVVAVIWAVAAINSWNRVAVPLGRLNGREGAR